MTLSARIRLPASGRVALLEAALPFGGLLVAGATLAARWPDAALATVGATTVAIAVSVGRAARRWRDRQARVVVVSDHAEVGLVGSEDVWRITEPSLVRPGFAVLALACGEPGVRRRLVLPVFDADLAPADRWALHRWIGWCQRGGTAARRS